MTGEFGARVDPRLDVFRDFVNSLEADAEGEHREGPAPESGRTTALTRPWARPASCGSAPVEDRRPAPQRARAGSTHIRRRRRPEVLHGAPDRRSASRRSASPAVRG